MVIINDAIWYGMIFYKFGECITVSWYSNYPDYFLIAKKRSHRYQPYMADTVMEDSHTYRRYYILFVSNTYPSFLQL